MRSPRRRRSARFRLRSPPRSSPCHVGVRKEQEGFFLNIDNIYTSRLNKVEEHACLIGGLPLHMMCTFLASCTKRGLGTCLVLHKRLKRNDIQVSICMHLPSFEECNITYKFFHMQLFARVRSLLYMDRYRRQFEFAKPCPFLWDYSKRIVQYVYL